MRSSYAEFHVLNFSNPQDIGIPYKKFHPTFYPVRIRIFKNSFLRYTHVIKKI